MRRRREQFLKLFCLLFGALLVFHVARLVVAKPFTRLTVPPLPSLPIDAQAQKAGGTNSSAKADSKTGTSSALNAKSNSGTNATVSKESLEKDATNALAAKASTISANTNKPGGGTNIVASSSTHSNSTYLDTKGTSSGTNAQLTEIAATNQESATPRKKSESAKKTVVSETAATGQNTNRIGTNISLAASTNAVGSTNASKGGTNGATAKNSRKKGPGGGPDLPGAPGRVAELPPEIKDRVDRIVQGEILGQVMRPMPMALLGIAGDSAMLRSPEGQTGLVKEGDNLGTIKLLKIGTNRVLVEVKGDGEPEKKELMIFAGLGSESLLPKETKEPKESREKKPDETTKKAP
jgi:hypothetical protein